MVRRGRIPSVGEVAQSAGVSRATAYRYFPSRSKLVSAVIAVGCFALVASAQTPPPAAQTAPVWAAGQHVSAGSVASEGLVVSTISWHGA